MNYFANEDALVPSKGNSRPCQSIEWYAEGQTRIVDLDGVQIAIRFVGRSGRRGRIAITAPPGAVFRAEAAGNALLVEGGN